MKIAQISSIYLSIPPKTHGGTERIVFELRHHLTKRGHQLPEFQLQGVPSSEQYLHR
jgi:hypothetical protein